MIAARPVVHVVEDDSSVRTAIARVLRRAGFDARCYVSAGEFLLTDKDDAPRCILLDIGLPGLGGMELHAGISKKEGAPPVVFLTGRGNVATSVPAMKAGAVDFLSKPVKREVLLAAIAAAVAKDAENRAARAHRGDIESLQEKLTMRERIVFARVVEGKPNKLIAVELGTSIRTVKSHRAQVKQKLEVKSLPELVRGADELGRGRGQ